MDPKILGHGPWYPCTWSEMWGTEEWIQGNGCISNLSLVWMVIWAPWMKSSRVMGKDDASNVRLLVINVGRAFGWACRLEALGDMWNSFIWWKITKESPLIDQTVPKAENRESCLSKERSRAGKLAWLLKPPVSQIWGHEFGSSECMQKAGVGVWILKPQHWQGQSDRDRQSPKLICEQA